MNSNDLYYSAKYYDDKYEYRHVSLPKEMVKLIPMHLMSEDEWRQIGVQQSEGWIHYMRHKPVLGCNGIVLYHAVKELPEFTEDQKQEFLKTLSLMFCCSNVQ